MLILSAIFGGFLVVIVGAYWAFVVRPENKSRTAMRGRLDVKGVEAVAAPALRKELARLSGIPALDKLLLQVVAVSQPIQRIIDESGVQLTVGLFVLMTACGAVVGYLVALLVSGYALLSLVFGLLGSLVPYLHLSRVRTARLRSFEEQFPEAIDLIARALRAGHAFTTGLEMAADELPPPVGTEFRLVYERQSYGMSLKVALKDLARRMPLLDARFFVTAVLTQRESGGNLAEVLDNLGKVIRERFKVKRQIRVATAHGRITGWVLVCFPPALALGFFFIVPENMILLVSDPIGQQMVAIAAGLQLGGSLIIRKLINVEY